MDNDNRQILRRGNRQLEVEIHPDGQIDIVACCLKTDSWEDYLAFKSQAAEASASGEKKESRRYLRAALQSLFSHFEGVLNEIHDKHVIPPYYQGDSFSVRTRNIAREAERRGSIPSLDFKFGKYLRDIIAHPGIEKIYQDKNNRTELTDTKIYKFLDRPTIKQIESDLTKWLDAVCSVFDVSRFPAEDELNEFVNTLLETSVDGIVDKKSRTERLVDLNIIKIITIDENDNISTDDKK